MNVGPFVDGTGQASRDAATFEVVNPSTGRPLRSIPAGCDADVDAAVASARAAFDDGRWSEAPPSNRKSVLHRWAERIAAEAAQLDRLDAEEMGKPVSTPAFTAAAASALAHFHAEAIDKITGDVYLSDKASFVTQRRLPRGVVAAVVPWNFPTFNAVLKVAPALAAGNCVVLKPSELSSRSALHLAELGMQAGFPPGILNVVPGIGEVVGRALGLHRDVDMVTFTGSTEVGKLMMQYAGQSNMKVVMAECGGKSPQVVFADGVDLDAAAGSIAGFLLMNQGQICSVGSRVLVQGPIEQPLVEKIAAHFQAVVMGDACDPKTSFGPLVSAGQCERVTGFIEQARKTTAHLVTGGRRALTQSGGYFIEPTLFRNVAPSDRIAQEEIFGPVLTVTSFQNEEEAIRLVNGTPYGLGAYVWTTSLSTGMRMAKGVRSSVMINSALMMGEGPGNAPSLEPYGQSGVGTEGGLAGLESYLRRQLVWFNH